MRAELSGDRLIRVGSSTIRSVLGTVAWSPDAKTLLYAPENPRRYMVLDLANNNATVLAPPDSAGWIYAPLFSPHGSEVVVARSDGNLHGTLRRVDLAQKKWTQLKGLAGFPRPLLWSEDGWIYVLTGRDIRRLRPNGGDTEHYATLPFECGSADLPSMSRDARRLVCTVAQANPDTWMATNFNPEVR